MAQILLIDDERSELLLLQKVLNSLGYECVAEQNPQAALHTLRCQSFDLVICDLVMPVIDGLEVLREALRIDGNLQVIMVSAVHDLSPVVDAIRAGAADFIPKPLNPQCIGKVTARALEKKELLNKNRSLKERRVNLENFSNIIASSDVMTKIFHTIEKVAKTNASVLISGESGTGKELIANAIHERSLRKNKPFMAVDCVAIPKDLIESELFGYEKGSFTGAAGQRNGLLSEADKGTFFFDEVTEIDYATQAKLLRVLQERKFRRVGGRELLDIDIRVVAATRRDPLQAVKEGVFREDLFYRLNVLPIHIPPLRERQEDIPLIIESVMESYRQEYNVEMEMSVEVLLKLQAYGWPGNVRELKNIVTRLCILAVDSLITIGDLPNDIHEYSNDSVNFEWLSHLKYKDAKDRWLEGFDLHYIDFVLKRYKGNVSKAARNSGVNRKTFQRLMTKYNL
ncbi:MAG: sigma-54-dependent Fis family transcriptional regulator [Lentisphaeraceae bacterium]|nr:sigma-54-dependent Fis family transcriptional regulator [Lentisphaeraceae bacterium]